MSQRTGLSDSQRTFLTTACIIAGVLQGFMTMAVLSDIMDIRTAAVVMFIMTGIGLSAGVIRESYGVRSAAVSAVSKSVDPNAPTSKVNPDSIVHHR